MVISLSLYGSPHMRNTFHDLDNPSDKGNQYFGGGKALTISFITQGFFVPINKVHFL